MSQKTVLITGISRGIGRACALAFAKAGYAVAGCCHTRSDLLDSLSEELTALGVPHLLLQGELQNSAFPSALVEQTIKQFGRLDVLINNAAALGPSPMPLLLDYVEDDFLNVLRANILSPFIVTKRVLPGMLQRNDGSIINVTSEAGQTGYAGWGAYGISKFALEGLTETWADELSETGIRVNMVDPGSMDTDMQALADPEPDEELVKPEDVVDVFLYLASDFSRTINGKRFEAQNFIYEQEG